MLCGEREQRSDTERDPGRHSFRLDPEGDPRHDDDEASRDVGVEEVVAQASLEGEHNLQAGEVSWRTYGNSGERVMRNEMGGGREGGGEQESGS